MDLPVIGRPQDLQSPRLDGNGGSRPRDWGRGCATGSRGREREREGDWIAGSRTRERERGCTAGSSEGACRGGERGPERDLVIGRSGDVGRTFGGAAVGAGDRFRLGSWMAGSFLAYISVVGESISAKTGEASGGAPRLDRGSIRGSYPCFGGGGLFARVLENGLILSNCGDRPGDSGISFCLWSSAGARKLSVMPPPGTPGTPDVSARFGSKADSTERDKLD